MENLKYTAELQKALQFCKHEDLFLGTGNPNADILFIGKEAAIDMTNEVTQYELEIKKNILDWENNFSSKKQFSDIDDWFKVGNLPTYNPLYPYKGQKKIVEGRSKEGVITKGSGGTSKTWYNYQKIVDSLYVSDTSKELINFHEYAFCTELNQATANYSHQISKHVRESSITKRKKLFKEEYFKKFSIKIVAVGHYVRDFNIDLQGIFEMKFDATASEKYSSGLNKEYINVHYDNLDSPTKLLIHTNQLSMVSNELVCRIGKVCNDFLKTLSAVEQAR